MSPTSWGLNILTTNLINDKNIFRIYRHFSPVKISHFSVAEHFLTKTSINIKKKSLLNHTCGSAIVH
jgi:hypothetical protein